MTVVVREVDVPRTAVTTTLTAVTRSLTLVGRSGTTAGSGPSLSDRNRTAAASVLSTSSRRRCFIRPHRPRSRFDADVRYAHSSYRVRMTVAPSWTAHPAPGPLGELQRFLNTHAYSGRPDTLGDWLEHTPIVAAPSVVAEADLRRMRELRESLRGLVAAATGREEPDPRVVARLRREASGVRVGLEIASEGGIELRPATSGVDRVVAALFLVVVVAMTDRSWARFKVCGNDLCRVAFWDGSRNRVARFCSSGRCANRVRQREFQRRRASL